LRSKTTSSPVDFAEVIDRNDVRLVAVVGDLIYCPDGTAAVCAPTRCPHGHQLGPGKMLGGHQPCNCRARGGHITWECLECCAVVYAPPFMADCQPLGGAAAVR
jgi:hypothetical protein